MKPIKKLIEPIQMWLLSRGQCVACGMPLEKGSRQIWDKDHDQITCKCSRVFIYNKQSQSYRRAKMSEIKK